MENTQLILTELEYLKKKQHILENLLAQQVERENKQNKQNEEAVEEDMVSFQSSSSSQARSETPLETGLIKRLIC